MSATVLHADAFEDNYIWLIVADSSIDNESRPVIVVDPGDETPVFETIEQENLKPVAILCTHHHWDHVGGAGAIAQRFDIPVYGPEEENISVVTHPVRDGDKVVEPVTGLQFEVLSIPGHTSGHIAYYGDNMLFCGDTLFSAGCGRLFEGTAEQMLSSLSKLAALPNETRVYCGHEYTAANLRFAMTVDPANEDVMRYTEQVNDLRQMGLPTLPSTLALEKDVNPFLRTGTTQIKRAVENHSGSQLKDEVAVFAEVRNWKDHFQG
ncbi:MAG: hydroxyacylglutathione hydrolase [Acidiferrobacterales bacterium]